MEPFRGKGDFIEGVESALYHTFTFETWHDFGLGISTPLKKGRMTFLDCNKDVKNKIWLHTSTRAVPSMKKTPINSANSLLTAIEDMCPPKKGANGLHEEGGKAAADQNVYA